MLNTLSFASNPLYTVFDTYRSAPNVNYSMFDTWLLIPLTDYSALFTQCPVLTAACAVPITYCSALGPSGIPYSTSRMKLFRFT